MRGKNYTAEPIDAKFDANGPLNRDLQKDYDDFEDFENIESQINGQLDRGYSNNIGDGLAAHQQEFRNSREPSDIGSHNLHDDENYYNKSELQNQLENEQFERIEEQIREESPMKSELGGHRLSPPQEDYDQEELDKNYSSLLSQQITIIDLQPRDFDMFFPDLYHNDDYENVTVSNETKNQDGKIHKYFLNDKKEVIFANKVRRETFPDGYIIVYFNNGDIKQTFPDGRVVYYFAEAQTTQTTMADGLQIFKFSNNQIEKHHQDGLKEIK